LNCVVQSSGQKVPLALRQIILLSSCRQILGYTSLLRHTIALRLIACLKNGSFDAYFISVRYGLASASSGPSFNAEGLLPWRWSSGYKLAVLVQAKRVERRKKF